MFDTLSPRAKNALSIDDTTAYMTLAPTKAGSAEARDAIELLKSSDVSTTPISHDSASAALAGLWLWHDFLHESHELSQRVKTPTGSFWHAIMHRREGDFSNAKYWYRQIGHHPACVTIAARVDTMTQSMDVDKSIFKLTAGGWRPDAFVDLIETVNRDVNDSRRKLAIDIGKIEWQTLFETTLREA